jgi:hypothetical protein
MEFPTALLQDVEITVRPARKEHGALSVVSAEIQDQISPDGRRRSARPMA